MIQFLIGLLVGGIIGFAACAICSMAARTETQGSKKIGEDDDGSN